MSGCCADGLPPRLPAYSSAAPGPGQRQDLGRDQGVVDDAVSVPERVQGMQREQARIARPCADEPDRARLDRGQRRQAGRRAGVLHRRTLHRRGHRRGITGGMTARKQGGTRELRRGWTTGACAAAATRAAYTALVTGRFPDPVSVTLPGGEAPCFPLVLAERGSEPRPRRRAQGCRRRPRRDPRRAGRILGQAGAGRGRRSSSAPAKESGS